MFMKLDCLKLDYGNKLNSVYDQVANILLYKTAVVSSKNASSENNKRNVSDRCAKEECRG